ncbi:hypothetical protein IPA_06825 [Ignicoccus pacificus DSM 13166]|uniref:Uncharacterized protein n=1 Tax=Ignicoccus pacificus DSM 13166 TaxID=940294 RepID=A0A977KBL4_9CREN|nr:hypothetical protein IPA_06825 [Ignicoccus pacificus DSM 13166]
MSWKPTFASKKLIKDYEPLRYYLELVKGTEWYDKAFLSRQDFEELVKEAKDLSTGKLGELWDKLTEKFMERIEPEKALQALKDAGYEVKSPEEARKRLAQILAGWLIEAGEEWDLIKFKDKE